MGHPDIHAVSDSNPTRQTGILSTTPAHQGGGFCHQGRRHRRMLDIERQQHIIHASQQKKF